MVGTSRPKRSQSSRLELDADPAGQRQQVDDGVGRAAEGAVGADGVVEGLAGEDLRHAQILVHHLDDAPAGKLGEQPRRGVDRRDGGVAGQAHAERLRPWLAMVEAVPMVMQWPAERDMQALGVEEIGERHLARLDVLAEAPDVGAGADLPCRGSGR